MEDKLIAHHFLNIFQLKIISGTSRIIARVVDIFECSGPGSDQYTGTIATLGTYILAILGHPPTFRGCNSANSVFIDLSPSIT